MPCVTRGARTVECEPAGRPICLLSLCKGWILASTSKAWGAHMIVDRSRGRWVAAAALVAASAVLSACGQNNTYVAPPPPKVVVAKPVEQKVTRYFMGTGNADAINQANLVARVQGFLKEI